MQRNILSLKKSKGFAMLEKACEFSKPFVSTEIFVLKLKYVTFEGGFFMSSWAIFFKRNRVTERGCVCTKKFLKIKLRKLSISFFHFFKVKTSTIWAVLGFLVRKLYECKNQ